MSERMFYQKIIDIFAECSIDYDKNSDTAITFYITIQNKFHFEFTGNMAAENNAERNITMYMEDWKNEVENALKIFRTIVI